MWPLWRAVLVLPLITLLPAQQTNLIVNGSFESPAGGWWAGLKKDSTHITNWVVTRGTVDYANGWFPCSLGVYRVDLDGTPGFGAIAQTFAATPNAAYLVTFDMPGDPSGAPLVKRLRVSAAGP